MANQQCSPPAAVGPGPDVAHRSWQNAAGLATARPVIQPGLPILGHRLSRNESEPKNGGVGGRGGGLRGAASARRGTGSSAVGNGGVYP